MLMQAQVGGQELQDYCTDFVNSSYSGQNSTRCHERCTQCFGLAADQCYECISPEEGVEINVEQLCMDTMLAGAVVNASVYNCSTTQRSDR